MEFTLPGDDVVPEAEFIGFDSTSLFDAASAEPISAECANKASGPADLEHRIDAYFSAQEAFPDRLRLSVPPNVLSRLGDFVAKLIGSSRGHRATPPESA
jgi:hypothetical protein